MLCLWDRDSSGRNIRETVTMSLDLKLHQVQTLLLRIAVLPACPLWMLLLPSAIALNRVVSPARTIRHNAPPSCRPDRGSSPPPDLIPYVVCPQYNRTAGTETTGRETRRRVNQMVLQHAKQLMVDTHGRSRAHTMHAMGPDNPGRTQRSRVSCFCTNPHSPCICRGTTGQGQNAPPWRPSVGTPVRPFQSCPSAVHTASWPVSDPCTHNGSSLL